jgi:DNA-binding HxlR family transcriptional regulator
MVNESIDFKNLKEHLQVTDGNLASHLKALEKLEMIIVKKQFIGRKPNTTYEATATGRQAFESHLKALEDLIKGQG